MVIVNVVIVMVVVTVMKMLLEGESTNDCSSERNVHAKGYNNLATGSDKVGLGW